MAGVNAENRDRPTVNIDSDQPLCLDIGQFAIGEQQCHLKALDHYYHVHSADIILASLLNQIDARANLRDLRSHLLALAKRLDQLTSQ
jgi:hypothetical protein